MVRTESSGGSAVLEMDEDEYIAWLDRQVRRRMNLSLRDFVEAYAASSLDPADPDVPFLVGMIGLGQQRHQIPA